MTQKSFPPLIQGGEDTMASLAKWVHHSRKKNSCVVYRLLWMGCFFWKTTSWKNLEKYGIKFSSAPILSRHLCALFTQMEEAKQNICLFTGQRCFCCLLDLIELKLMWSIRISENVSKAKWKSVILLGYLNKCGNIAERSWRVLEAATLAYANKTKESITFQKLSSYYFLPVANIVPNKGKFAITWPRDVVFCIRWSKGVCHQIC